MSAPKEPIQCGDMLGNGDIFVCGDCAKCTERTGIKITNHYGLPDTIVRAVQNDPYTKGDADYSVSDLISPPRQFILKKRHQHEIEEDASDRVWSLFGQAVHHIAERANIEGVVERRLRWGGILGKVISGAMDHYHPKSATLTDYKTCSVFKFTFKDFKDWEEQQNCYAQLLRWNGEKINKLQIVAFVKDWRTREAKTAEFKNEYYPNKAERLELPLWSEEKAIGFITSRVTALIRAEKVLPECSPEERWARPSQWAVKKVGGSKAIPGGLFAVEAFALKMLESLPKGAYEIEHRPGVSGRCENYCVASKHCLQYKALCATK